MVGARAIAAEERLDARGELVVVERLAEIVVGADPQANHAIGRVVLRREEQHWYVRIATELQAETDPVDARHEHVEGDEIGVQLGERGHRLARIGDRVDLVTGLGQHRTDQGRDVSVVVDHQDPATRGDRPRAGRGLLIKHV